MEVAKIKRFDKDNLNKLEVRMHDALNTVGKEYGVSIEFCGGKYKEHEANLKLKVSILDEDGGNKQGREDFVLYGERYGFDAEDFGKTFTCDGREFRIVGWNRRRRKYSVSTVSVVEDQPFYFTPHPELFSELWAKPIKFSIVLI